MTETPLSQTDSRSWPGTWIVALAAVTAVWFALLLTRRLGLHIDENNYFRIAHSDFFGDSALSNKPYAFYAVNYLFMNGIGRFLGPLHPVALHLLYFAGLTASCAHLARRLRSGATERLTIFLAVLLSPFLLFNSTQLMMENAQYPVLALLFGLLLDPEAGVTKRSSLALFALALLSVLIKETSVAALAVLAIGFRERRNGVWPLCAVMAIGVSMAVFASHGGVDTPQKTYGSLTSLPGFDELADRAEKMAAFAWTWVFLLTLPLCAAAVLAAVRDRAVVGSRKHVRILIASLVAAAVIGFLSKEDFVRYSYPVVFLALCSAVTLASGLKRWVLPMIIVAGAVPVWNMWTPDDGDRLSLWPSILTRELYYSGFTVLPGYPLHAWSVLSAGRRTACASW